ncbi:MAG: hypothetical protein WDN26_00060 [Chitinophagaceae bacterium]
MLLNVTVTLLLVAAPLSSVTVNRKTLIPTVAIPVTVVEIEDGDVIVTGSPLTCDHP